MKAVLFLLVVTLFGFAAYQYQQANAVVSFTHEGIEKLLKNPACKKDTGYTQSVIDFVEKYYHDKFVNRRTLTEIKNGHETKKTYAQTKEQIIQGLERSKLSYPLCLNQIVEVKDITFSEDNAKARIKFSRYRKLQSHLRAGTRISELSEQCTQYVIAGDKHPIFIKSTCISKAQSTNQ